MSIFKKKIVISLIFVTLFSLGASFYSNKFNKDRYQKELTFDIYDIMSDVNLTIIWTDFGIGLPDLSIKKYATKLDSIILNSSNPCKKLSMVSNDLPVLIFYKAQQIEIEIQSSNKEYLEKCSEFIQSEIDIFNKKQTDYFLKLASILRMKRNTNNDTSIMDDMTDSEYTTYMKRQSLDVERIKNVKFLNLSYEREFVLEKPSFLIIFLSIFTVLMAINFYLHGSEGSKRFKKFKAKLNKFIS
jgi:hypothetical protein